MRNNSSYSNNSNGIEPFDIMSMITDIDSETIDLIGQEQLSQIDSLKVEKQSLENQLSTKDEDLYCIKKRVGQICMTINQIIQSLLNSVNPDDKQKISILKKINKEKNEYDKIDQYITFMHNFTETNSESYNRICEHLRGYLQLMELISNGAKLPFDIQSQSTFQKVFLEESQKTNDFLKNQFKNISAQNSGFTPIEKVLDINNFSPESRLEKIQTFIYGYDIPIDELKTLLLQEIVITDTLRNYISKNIDERENRMKNQQEIEEEIRNEITQNLSEKVRIETEKKLRGNLENEIRLKVQSQQQEYFNHLKLESERREEELNGQIQLLKGEIERMKKYGNDDLVNNIKNGDDSQLKRRIISLLRPEIEEDVRNQISLENSLNEKKSIQSEKDQIAIQKLKQDLEEQRKLLIQEKQLRAQAEMEFRQKETGLMEQLQQLREKIANQLNNNSKSQTYSNYKRSQNYSNENNGLNSDDDDGFDALNNQNRPNYSNVNNRFNSDDDNGFDTSNNKNRSNYSNVNNRFNSDDDNGLTNHNRPIFTSNKSGNGSIELGGLSAIEYNRTNVDRLYDLLNEACGGVSPDPQSDTIEFHTDIHLNRVLNYSMVLARDVCAFRAGVKNNPEGRFNFLSQFNSLEAQVSHLDQLHTQTRSLLIRQSYLIADLRKKTGATSWATWALNLYKILECSGIQNPGADFDVLKKAIEEKAEEVMGNERFRSLRYGI